jgi:hypothetical protein
MDVSPLIFAVLEALALIAAVLVVVMTVTKPPMVVGCTILPESTLCTVLKLNVVFATKLPSIVVGTKTAIDITVPVFVLGSTVETGIVIAAKVAVYTTVARFPRAVAGIALPTPEAVN